MSRTTYLQEPGKSRRPPAFPSLTWEMSMTKKGNTRRYIMVHHGSSWYIHVYWVYWILQTTHFVNQSEKSHWNSHDWLFWYFFCLVNSFWRLLLYISHCTVAILFRSFRLLRCARWSWRNVGLMGAQRSLGLNARLSMPMAMKDGGIKHDWTTEPTPINCSSENMKAKMVITYSGIHEQNPHAIGG